MPFQFKELANAWWDSLSKEQKQAYIKKHPRSKYAKMGTGGDAPKMKERNESDPLFPAFDKKKKSVKKVDPAKKKARISKAKELIKKSEHRLGNASKRIDKLELTKNYLDDMKNLWQAFESDIGSEGGRYRDTANKKVVRLMNRYEKLLSQIDKAHTSEKKAEQTLSKRRAKLKELESASTVIATTSDVVSHYLHTLVTETHLTYDYLKRLKSYVTTTKAKQSINKRLKKLDAREKKIEKRIDALEAKISSKK